VEARPFAKSTLQLFCSQLILNEKMWDVFKRSLEVAKEAGYLKQRKPLAYVRLTCDNQALRSSGYFRNLGLVSIKTRYQVLRIA
jgi:hypothetical protein